MKFFGFLIYPASLRIGVLILLDSIRTNLFGLGTFPGRAPTDIAKNIFQICYKDNILWAGMRHFQAMWVSDFAVGLCGMEMVFSASQIKILIQHMIDLSSELGYVPTSFTKDYGFDAPGPRGDSFPSLLYCVWEYCRLNRDRKLFEVNKEKLQVLLNEYEKASFGPDGLIGDWVILDWVDTVDRPSSTWNNLFALKTIEIAEELGLTSRASSRSLEKKILEKRLRGDYFIDHAETENLSVDSAVLAVYLHLFDRKIQKALFKKLRELDLFEPFPMRACAYKYRGKYVPLVTKLTAPGYHDSAIWPHLGLMYLNGCKKLGIPFEHHLKKLETLIMKFHNIPEVMRADGKDIYRNILTSESGIPMGAGQYLEVISELG